MTHRRRPSFSPLFSSLALVLALRAEALAQQVPEQQAAPLAMRPAPPLVPLGASRFRDAEYRGGPVPMGARVVLRQEPSMRAMTIAGAVLMGAGLLTGVFGAAAGVCSSQSAEALGLSFIPFAGSLAAPFSFGNTSCYSDLSYLLIVTPISQVFYAIGTPMFFATFARRTRVLRYHDPALAQRPSRELQWALLPGASGAPLGLTFSAVNF